MAPSLDAFPLAPHSEQDYYSSGIRAKYTAEVARLTTIDTKFTLATTDITYEPSISRYLALSARRSELISRERDLPNNWPQILTGPLAWTNSDFKNESEWVFDLSDSHKEEIYAALQHFNSLSLSYDKVTKSTFRLPKLAESLLQIRDEIYQGRGFAVIRGLVPDEYSHHDFAVIFLGISSYIAERRGKQDQRGSMMIHVIDRHPTEKDNSITRGEQPFHTDVVCDTLALATRSCSSQGGQGFLASSWSVYNELAVTRPDIIHTLSKPDWPHDTFGRTPAYYNRALLFHVGDRVILNFSRRLLTGHSDTPRTPGIPGLTEAQAEALEAIHFVAQKHQINMTLKKGDLRYFNNMAMVHSREAFQDDENNQRHLLRLWLSNPELMWQLDPVLEVAWSRVFDDSHHEKHWDAKPFMINGKIIHAESCD